MIDDWINRLRGNGTETKTTTSSQNWSDEQLRETAYRAQYRCASCDIPEFRGNLYMTPDSETILCESCLRSNGHDANEQLPQPTIGKLGYLIDHETAEAETLKHREDGSVEIKVDDKNGIWMGVWPREMVESKAENPRSKLWLGYFRKGNRVQEVGVDFNDLFQHTFVQGTTGGGKSTWALFALLQLIWADNGVCVIDPHGDLIKDLLRKMPPHRRNDVILFDPVGSICPTHPKQVSLNLFEVEKDESDGRQYYEAVNGAVADVRSGLRQEGNWGQLMGPICENLSRGLIRHPKPHSFLDFEELLHDSHRRQEFADEIEQRGMKFSDFTQDIADMPKDDMGALIRRLESWSASPISREIIAHRHSSISFSDIVREGRILLVNTNLADPDMQQMVSSTVFRRIWKNAKHSAQNDRSPFFLLIDELDDVLNDEMGVDDVLGNGRKFGIGLILMTQYLKKLKDTTVEESIKKLCKTTLTFRDPEGDFTSRPESAAANLPDYKAICRIKGVMNQPVKLNGFPPYPDRRTMREAREWIAKPALDRHGVESHDESEDTLRLTDERKQTLLKLIHDQSIRSGREDGSVRFDDVRDRIIELLDDDIAAHIDHLISQIPAGEEDGDIERWEAEGQLWLRVTARGQRSIFQTGSGITSGGPRHSQLMTDAYEPLTEIGLRVEIPEQSSKDMPDATIVPDDDLPTDLVQRLTDSSEVAVEAENSTARALPGQTCRNLAQAVNDGKRCLFLARPDTAPKLWGRLTDPPFKSKNTVNGQHRLYHVRSLSINGETVLRPAGASETVWMPEPDGRGYALRDTNDNEYHRFGSAKAVVQDAGAYPKTVPASADTPDNFTEIKEPFIPQREFVDGNPDRSQWDIIVVPGDAEKPADLGVYNGNETIPLTDLLEYENKTPSRDDAVNALDDLLD